ncbi:MAG: bifunctional DNA primase/polymerase [Deltaproteobacteria bacterium]|nr:bifunctional DNA primase/polymerase [Deltaproteobacteria bacterium]
MKSRDSALAYNARGFSVIPIEPRGKKPLIGWEEFQTRKAAREEIKSWWTKWPAANIGIVTGAVSGMMVIDVDTEAAKEKLKTLVADYDLHTVPRTRTGRGWQLFFQHPGVAIQNRAGVFPGLDVRGDGGYVVAPPSIHPNGRQYEWEMPLTDELPKLPIELHKLITEPPDQTYRTRFNTAEALHGVEMGRRDETVFKLACKLRNADVPQEMAEQLILEAARNCEPPFSEKIALDKAKRAYAKYQAGDNGAKEPEFWPELLSAKDILQAPKDPTRWILENCLPVGGCSVLVAKPKVGKSTLAADLCLSVARGEIFLGRMTQQSPVGYLFLDGPLPEIADVFVSLGLRESDPVFLHAGSAPRDAIDWLLFTVKQKATRLVVIDTFQKMLRLKDLNDYAEVTNKMEPVLDAAREGRCHVMMLHHAGKNSADDLDAVIGSTAIRGLCYTYFFEKRLPNSDRRILSSDQWGGKNFPETAIGFNRATGRLEVQGTMEEAEIEEAEPLIIEFLRAEGGDVLEKMIRENVNLRAFIVSKALRKLFRQGHVDRTGKGRKGSPFHYSLVATLEDSIPGKGVLGGEDSGRESEKQEKSLAGIDGILFPEKREENGKSTEENPKGDATGRESDEGWEFIA